MNEYGYYGAEELNLIYSKLLLAISRQNRQLLNKLTLEELEYWSDEYTNRCVEMHRQFEEDFIKTIKK